MHQCQLDGKSLMPPKLIHLLCQQDQRDSMLQCSTVIENQLSITILKYATYLLGVIYFQEFLVLFKLNLVQEH